MSSTLIRAAVVAAVLSVASFSSYAGLIINGDFEANAIKPGSWTSLSSNRVDGWQGSNIEIWNALNGVHAVSGNHFIELNANGANQGPWSIFQSFATVTGQEYQLDFYYRARTKNKESFEVSLANVSQTLSDHTMQEWRHYTSSFTAIDSLTTLRFTSLTSGTYGNFLDAIQVSALPTVAAVSAPGTFAAFGVGLLALMANRRQRKQQP